MTEMDLDEDVLEIKVESVRKLGWVECPRCRFWHGNKLNPLATTSRKKGKGFGTVGKTGWHVDVFETTVSPICDKCCDNLLEAFSDPDWRLFWPGIADEEAETIISRILESKEKQRETCADWDRRNLA